MTQARELIIAALEEKRPLVLVLGQDAWHQNGEVDDPVLAKALARLRREQTDQRGWLQLLDASPLPPTFYEWLTERFERRVPPEWLSALAVIPWSAVFTLLTRPDAQNNCSVSGSGQSSC